MVVMLAALSWDGMTATSANEPVKKLSVGTSDHPEV